jgi:protein AbiQ
MNRKKNYSLNYLSESFYQKYNVKEYPEMENKRNRPYMVMLITIENNTFAIPFRTNVKHNNCYKFKNSTRTTSSVTGLDYSKAVIVNESSYIGPSARINDKEYDELDSKSYIIITRFKKYLQGYIDFVCGNSNVYKNKQYRYTTLQYFHKELNLD